LSRKSQTVGVLDPLQYLLDGVLPKGKPSETLSLQELKRLRELVRNSVDRTQADLDRIDALIVATAVREQRRREVHVAERGTDSCEANRLR
jgi:hypothetical protein